jgi:hypothetical protein
VEATPDAGAAMKLLLAWWMLTPLLISFAGNARADANSYLAYVHSHGINTGLASDSKILHAGMFACDSLHAGQTPDQVVGGVPFSWMDVRGVIDAAQHELCPDTLH